MSKYSKKAHYLAAIISLSPLAASAAERIDTGQAGPALARQLGAVAGGGVGQSLRQVFQLDMRNSFRSLGERKDKRGNSHTRYQQLFDGIPIYGEQVITHGESGGNIRAVSGKVIGGIENDLPAHDARAQQVSADEAMQRAKQELVRYVPAASVAAASFRNERIELVIYVDAKGVAQDAWSISYVAEASGAEPVRPYFIMDADDGSVIRTWNGMAHAQIGTGPGGNERIGLIEYGTERPPLDVTQVSSTCTMNNAGVKTVNMSGSTGSYSTAFSYLCPRNTVKYVNGGYSPLNDAHYFGTVADAMFHDYFGVAPLSSQMVLRVHYDTEYENAFWDGTYTNFGDGKDHFYPMSTSLNVVAHEMAHGVTEQNAGLEYIGQSGGINESFSDMVGEAAEYYANGSVDWLVGSDVVKGKAKALRYFESPAKDGASIGSALDYYDGIDVHHSSGVFNRAYFLLSSAPGWNPGKALEVFYHANVNYWVPTSNYVDAACGAINAADDLTYDKSAVVAAFQLVNVNCPVPALDADGDFMDDNWETLHGLNTSANDSAEDPDGDGLSNREEYFAGTDPKKADSDNDGIDDAYDPMPTDADWLGFLAYDTVVNRGDAVGSKAGFSVASGDVDGDGFADIVVGAPYYDLKYRGKRYPDVGFVAVVSGKTGSVVWYNIGSWKGERYGYDVAVGGDMDGDGIKDFVVGIPGRDVPNYSTYRYMKDAGSAEVYSVFGFDPFTGPSAINVFDGAYAGDRFGTSVDGVGDQYNDGYDDVVIGAPGVDTYDGMSGNIYKDAGAVFVMDAAMSVLVAEYYNAGTGDKFGSSVAGIGDITGDGRDEVIAGAPFSDEDTGKDAGSVYVMTPYNDGTHNNYLTGLGAGERFGASVAAAGDANNDGIADFVVGYPYANKRAGGAAIFLGKGNTTQLGFLRAKDGVQAKSYMGASVAGVMDVDGDGRDDMLVGSPGFDVIDNATGKTLVDAGRVQLFSGADGSELWSAAGKSAKDNFGNAVASGDVNGDGAGDAVIGASGDDVPGGSVRKPKSAKDAGSVSVINGKAVAP